MQWAARIAPHSVQPPLSVRSPHPARSAAIQEAIHLGKWATKEQAGRAVDIASLKLLGEGVQVGCTCILGVGPGMLKSSHRYQRVQ